MMTALLLALLPIVLLIALGAGLRRHVVLSDAFWPQAERLSYYILLPALFIQSLASARLEGLPVGPMVAALVASTVAVALCLLAARRFLSLADPAFTSVFQGGVRFNNYVGISAAAGLLGAQGVALAAVANAAIVPTVNILCVLVFARYGRGGDASLRGIVRQLLRNPLVLACLVGIALQASGLSLPTGLDQTLKTLGQASLALGLLCVGAALDFSGARRWLHPLGLATLSKFALMPLATLLACHAFGLHGPAAVAALLFQTLPTASSSYIMARQLGGDAPLMAGIIATQTLLASIALPLTLLGLASGVR